jgi:hypothetical protein
MARAHAHSSTVMWDALSSLPPPRRGVKLGICCGLIRVSAPSAPPTWLQLSHCLRYGTMHRAGAACGPAPDQTPCSCTCTLRDAHCRFRHTKSRVRAAVRTCVYGSACKARVRRGQRQRRRDRLRSENRRAECANQGCDSPGKSLTGYSLAWGSR